MSSFDITIEELKELSEIFSRHKLDHISKDINLKIKSDKTILNVTNMYIFNDKFVYLNTELLKSLYEYSKDKPFNIAHFFEHQVLYGHNWNDEFNGYVRLIKCTDYSSVENDKLYTIIHKQSPDTQNIFWGLVSLTPLIQDNDTCVKAFRLILKDKLPKMGSFGLIELEKIKRVWDKRFKGIDISTLPQAEYIQIKEAFDKITNSKTKSFCTALSGNYLNITIDTELTSQENRKSKNHNQEALQGFFYCFRDYIEKNPNEKNPLSLNRIHASPEGYNLNVILYYNDLSQTESIKLIFNELVGYSITKDKDGVLQANTIKSFNAEQFFSTFIMNHILDNSLDKKIETKTKKSKM